MALQPYLASMRIHHKAGKSHTNADALSRLPTTSSLPDQLNFFSGASATADPTVNTKLLRHQTDGQIQLLNQCISAATPLIDTAQSPAYLPTNFSSSTDDSKDEMNLERDDELKDSGEGKAADRGEKCIPAGECEG